MNRMLAILMVLIGATFPATAEEWVRFDNEKYDYSVEVPAHFEMQYPDEEGWTFVDASGARLIVFAGTIFDTAFEGEASNKIVFAGDSGWEIIDSLVGQERMKFTGTKGSRVLEGYGIWLCNPSAVFINFEYNKALAGTYAPVVERVKVSLTPPAGCDLQEGFYYSP